MRLPDEQKIHFEESGSGTPVLFVPGSYSTPSAWRGMQKCLGDEYRLVGTSLCGYGDSSETRRPGDCDISHGIRLIETVAAQIGEPVHLVGHSFGGYLSLATALAGKLELLSLCLFEANPIPILRPSREDLFAVAEKMTTGFAAALARGDVNAAALIIDFWGGQGSFDTMPQVVQDYCRATAGANLLDWHGAMAADLSAHDCWRLDFPVLLVRGSEANELMVAMTDLLRAHLPKAQPEVVDGAGHFLISSHPRDCGSLLAQFLASARSTPTRSQR